MDIELVVVLWVEGVLVWVCEKFGCELLSVLVMLLWVVLVWLLFYCEWLFLVLVLVN